MGMVLCISVHDIISISDEVLVCHKASSPVNTVCTARKTAVRHYWMDVMGANAPNDNAKTTASRAPAPVGAFHLIL